MRPEDFYSQPMMNKLASLRAETIEKLAFMTRDDAVSTAALPVIGGGAGAGLYGLAGLAGKAYGSGGPGLGARLARGGAIGGGIGLGLAGLITLGKALNKADPSGKTLETAIQLAPAALAMAGAMHDRPSRER